MPSMRNRLALPTRLLGLLSILLFAGMGVGFSMLDAVRFHGRGNESSGRDHYDPAGGCRDHAENCVLLFSGATDRAAPFVPTETRLPQTVTTLEPRSGDPAVSHAVLLAPSSRAPPSLLV
ncbi:MAG: hypothetical protein ABI836_06875 [Gemmatimonadota bacterium]